MAALLIPGPAYAQDFQVSAQVDRTSLDVGGRLTLTVTLEGNLAGTELKPLQLPLGFTVAAQTRSSNVFVQPGGIRRAVSLVYVLMPKEAGTFKLGPFTVVRKAGSRRGKPQEVSTDPIEIVVKKAVLPPGLKPHERFFL